MARTGKVDVRVIVEGGGDASIQDGPFRIGYGTFLRKIAGGDVDGRPLALEVVRGKGGRATVDKFLNQRRLYPDALLVLLLDSEVPVPEGTSVWSFIKARHGFERPTWADEANAYLMVQCVETWLVSDPDALASHYGAAFKREKLPKRTNLEEEPKDDVQRKLGEAIGGKGTVYPHVDATKIIAKVDPKRIASLSHGARLVEGLRTTIEEFARR